MQTFDSVTEDFVCALDSLRDFVTSVGPLVAQKQRDAAASAARAVAPFRAAELLSQQDLGGLNNVEVSPDLLEARNILIGADPGVPPDKLAGYIEQVRTFVPIKISAGRIEPDYDHPRVVDIVVQKRILETVKQELRLLQESALMVLTSRSEWLIAQLIHLFFARFPEAAGLSEPFFSFDTLASLENLQEARQVLLDHKVESIMRSSLGDWLKFFKEKAKLGMSYIEADAPRLNEIFSRRNLIVHNGGRVSRRYFKEVPESLRVGLNLGDLVPVTSDYLSQSIALIEHQFVLLAAELWKKVDPSDSARGALLLRKAVDCLDDGRWATAKGFSYFAIHDKENPEAIRLSGQINYWQSFKWSGHYDEIRAEVENADFSAKSPLFRLAHAAISDNFDSFFAMLPDVLASGDLKKYQLATWPLFRDVRERPEYGPYAPPKPPSIVDVS